jgi:hypothetical protein
MKNVSNPYGYYLTEDFETIELRGNFEENAIFLPTKNPDEQLIYKVFVSPKKAINFAIQIVGGTNPSVVYIPQHMYKDLQIAYNENNPYYTIKDVTVIKLDFTETGNSLIKYLKQKFEKLDKGVSKLTSSGVSAIVNYAGFDSSGNPIDEDIIKQILYLFEEQDAIIFVNKDDALVTEQIANSKSLKSNRIKGDFNYTSNYFDGSGKFSSELLNSETNIKLESSTISSVLQLNDFVKDFAGKSLTDVNSIYKSNIVKDTLISQAPKIAGLVLDGLQKALPLVKGLKDKVSQLKAQKAAKKAEELKTLGKGKLSSAKDQASSLISGGKEQAAGMVSRAKDSATEAVDSVKDIVKKPVVPQISNKVPEKVNVKTVENKYKDIQDKFDAEQDEKRLREKAARLAGLEDGDYDEDAFENRIYTDPIDNEKYNNVLSNLKKKARMDAAEESLMNIKTDSKATSTKTISTIGNVSQAEGQQMIKNVGKSTPSSIKQINADFLKF